MSEPQEPYAPKLVQLPGTPPSAETVLHRTLNKIEHIESVTIVIKWKADASMEVDWSSMSKSDLYMAARVLDAVAVRETTPTADSAR